MSANAAKELVREAMLYDQLGHRAEGRALLRYAHTVCPAAPEVQRAEAQLARCEHPRLPGVRRVASKIADWLYLPAVIATSIGTAYLLSNILFV